MVGEYEPRCFECPPLKVLAMSRYEICAFEIAVQVQIVIIMMIMFQFTSDVADMMK